MPHGPIDIDATLAVLEADLVEKTSTRDYWYSEIAFIDSRIKSLQDSIKRLKTARALFEGIPEDDVVQETPPG